MNGVLLVGAGGHAKAVVEAVNATLGGVAAYVDARPASWLAVRRIDSDDAALKEKLPFVLGVGGLRTDLLATRLALFARYIAALDAPPVIHPDGRVSEGAILGAGTIVLSGVTVQPGAKIGRAAIINTRAIIEHDSQIGDGTHVAPGAIVLGDAIVGSGVLIGAGAVILPAARVPDGALVPALTRFGGKS